MWRSHAPCRDRSRNDESTSPDLNSADHSDLRCKLMQPIMTGHFNPRQREVRIVKLTWSRTARQAECVTAGSDQLMNHVVARAVRIRESPDAHLQTLPKYRSRAGRLSYDFFDGNFC